jgi:hypothetical protein
LWHILCSCPLHNEARNSFFKNKILPTKQNLHSILNPENKEDCLRLARFVNTCLVQIQEILSL